MNEYFNFNKQKSEIGKRLKYFDEGDLNEGLHGTGGINPVILNLDNAYAVREQLHGQAAFISGEVAHWTSPIVALPL
jgi:hypothetical protein